MIIFHNQKLSFYGFAQFIEVHIIPAIKSEEIVILSVVATMLCFISVLRSIEDRNCSYVELNQSKQDTFNITKQTMITNT